MSFPKTKTFVSIGTTILACCYATFGNTKDLISSTCETTLYVKLCESSLRSDPRSEGSDLRGLVAISLNQTIATGLENLAYINNISTHSVSSYGKSQLRDCDGIQRNI